MASKSTNLSGSSPTASSSCSSTPSLYVFGGLPICASKLAEKLIAGTDTWIKLKEMPTGRSYFAAAVVKGLIYVIGGRDAKMNVINSIDSYDPVRNIWKPIVGIHPTYPRSEFGAAAVKDKIFLVGGFAEACQKVECFDVKLNNISERRGLERGRWGLGVAVCRRRIYACGGQWHKYKESDEQTRRLTTIYLNDVESYDPVIDQWAREPGMLRRRGFFDIAVYEDSIYAVGGVGGECNRKCKRRLDTVEKFDTYTSQWTMIQVRLDGCISNLAVGVLNSNLIIVGGTQERKEDPLDEKQLLEVTHALGMLLQQWFCNALSPNHVSYQVEDDSLNPTVNISSLSLESTVFS